MTLIMTYFIVGLFAASGVALTYFKLAPPAEFPTSLEEDVTDV